jgi:putative DNA methylase
MRSSLSNPASPSTLNFQGVTVSRILAGRGGSTIVEAQRLGFPTIASDLNPVPVLITTALCRIPQLFRNQRAINPDATRAQTVHSLGLSALVEDIRYYARVVRDRAWQALKAYYPLGPGGEEVLAWRWAWAVPSPNPALRGAMTPLVTDWVLSESVRGKAWVAPQVHGRDIRYTVTSLGDVPERTVGDKSARCLFTGGPIPLEYVRAQGKAGRLVPHMFAIVGERNGRRVFVAPSSRDFEPALDARGIELPDADLPEKALGFRVQGYGVKRFSSLFLPRQARAIATFSELVRQVHEDILIDARRAGLDRDETSLEDGGCGARAYADAVTAILGLCVGRLAVSNNILVQWFLDPRSGSGKATPAFRMQTVSMVWDFVETNPFSYSVGGWSGPVVESALQAFALAAEDGPPAEVLVADARDIAVRVPSSCLVATDPPYYANIGYADLSDFFYIWLRRSLRESFPKIFATLTAPKANELIAAPYRHGDSEAAANEYFRSGFRDVFHSLAARVGDSYPLSVIYAIKQTESKERRGVTGWEVFLEGVLEAGLSVVATWPIRTTTLTRSRGLNSNALASAICVVCRPRAVDAPQVSRRDFLTELRQRLLQAISEFQTASIAPVDLAQAAIGPGMAVYTSYSKVLDAGGKPVSVREALALINQNLDEALAEQESEFDSGSRWALTWFEQSGFADGEYGMAEQLSKAKNTSVDGMRAAGIVASKAGKVRLLKPSELPEDWDPVADLRLTAWETVHQLIRALEAGGEGTAAELVAKLGGRAEVAHDLAYRLYTICERKKRAAEALSYNGLVQSWPEITRLAREGGTPRTAQSGLFEENEE